MTNYRFSSISTYAECPRKYYYSYLQNVDDGISDKSYVLSGTLFHEGIAEALVKNINDKPELALQYGQQAIRNYIDIHNIIDDKVIDSGLAMYQAYAPLFVNNNATPYIYEDTPLIEYKFEYTLDAATYDLPNDVTFSGTIDAVLVIDDNIVLYDWKTRGKFLDTSAVRLDAQLYLYSFILKEMGIPLTHAYQVQLLRKVPDTPIVNDDKVSLKNKTTKDIFVNTLELHGLNKTEISNAMATHMTKLVDMSYFYNLVSVPIQDVTLHRQMTHILDYVFRMENDTLYPRVNKAYTCGNCPFYEKCLNDLIGS